MELRRTPVTIITGFLGAGKTTLLNNLIKKHPEKKFAIIENEFGEIGIDGGLVVGVKDNIFELSNGCICCSLNDGFVETVSKLLESPHPFNHLLVETTGIADPDSIIKAFLSSVEIQANFMLDSVVCLADAVNMEDLMNEQPEVRKQLAVADIILLNKTESVQADYAKSLSALILKINPMAAVHPVQFARVEEINILDTFVFSAIVVADKTLSFQNLAFMRNTPTEQAGSLLNTSIKHQKHNIYAEGFIIPGSFDAVKFTVWIQNMLLFNRDSIFRVKGILSFEEFSEKTVFHSVRDSFMFEQLEPWENEMRFCKLVFIGKNLDRDLLEDNLYELLSTVKQ
jgi:G3E family GTPase